MVILNPKIGRSLNSRKLQLILLADASAPTQKWRSSVATKGVIGSSPLRTCTDRGPDLELRWKRFMAAAASLAFVGMAIMLWNLQPIPQEPTQEIVEIVEIEPTPVTTKPLFVQPQQSKPARVVSTAPARAPVESQPQLVSPEVMAESTIPTVNPISSAAMNPVAESIQEEVVHSVSGPALLDRPPRLLGGPAPEYPPLALDRGKEGTVVALITTTVVGNVEHVEIIRSAGSEFDRAVIQAAMQAKFEVPLVQGQPVAVRFQRSYVFSLEE